MNAFFSKSTFQNILSGIPSECQTVWIKIRLDIVRPDVGAKSLQRLSADGTSRQRIKKTHIVLYQLFNSKNL